MRAAGCAVLSAVMLGVFCAGCAEQAPQVSQQAEPAGQKPIAELVDPAPPEVAEFVAPPLTESEIAEGWISLFDGRSTFGWTTSVDSDQPLWTVEDGVLTATGDAPSLLLTPFAIDNFELRCSAHLEAGGNSGIFLRTADAAANPATDTYELNICDGHATHATGSLVGRVVAENVPAVEGAWHDWRVRCEGSRIQVWLDEQMILDFTDESDAVRLSGKIGLQVNQGRIAFRDVCLLPLGYRELLSGDDLSGWHEVPEAASEFRVSEGLLNISGGPGFLESDETFADFVLSATVRLNGAGINSGIFFRSMQGTADAPSNGYEMQLNNAMQDSDPVRPADSGTGAIFRRVQARRIVAGDNEFFTAVLIAQGDHFCSWVNGYQVVSWQDERADDENPRRGRRLTGGHLILQGHDPGTNVDFRSIRVQKLVE